jgi:hypothetical protein
MSKDKKYPSLHVKMSRKRVKEEAKKLKIKLSAKEVTWIIEGLEELCYEDIENSIEQEIREYDEYGDGFGNKIV